MRKIPNLERSFKKFLQRSTYKWNSIFRESLGKSCSSQRVVEVRDFKRNCQVFVTLSWASSILTRHFYHSIESIRFCLRFDVQLLASMGMVSWRTSGMCHVLPLLAASGSEYLNSWCPKIATSSFFLIATDSFEWKVKRIYFWRPFRSLSWVRECSYGSCFPASHLISRNLAPATVHARHPTILYK